MSWKEILDFRDREQSLREDFRNEVEEIAERIPKVGDTRYIRSKVQQEHKRVKLLIAKQQHAMRSLNVDTVASALTISSPAVITGVAAKLGLAAASTNILLGTGVAVLAIAWWLKDRRERRNLRDGAPFQYLLDVHQLTNRRLPL